MMDHTQKNITEYDECKIHGICSISSALSHMQEATLIYLETLAFYILEIEELGLHNEKIRNDIIDVFSWLTANIESNQKKFYELISTLYENLFQAKEIYIMACKERNIAPKHPKSSVKVTKKYNINKIIKQGQKSFLEKNQSFSKDQKKLLDVLFLILKSICLYMVELEELNVNIDCAYKELLFTLCMMHLSTIATEDLDEIIKKSITLDCELMQKTFETRKEEFGNIEPAEVSVSTRIGKAILVAGTNMKELELVLKATQDKGIDVYTHGQMIVGHAFPKLKAYPNLVGNYGKGIEYCISDFSSFPGSIYLTKLAMYPMGYLYHSKIFTNDKIAQTGIITLEANDFEPLIQAALSSEGFTETKPEEIIKIGLVEEDFVGRVHKVIDAIETKKIKHLIAIGVSNKTDSQKQYFENFLELIEDDCFVISASYTNSRENVMSVNMDYVFPFAYKVINILKQRNIFADLNTTIFFTHCEPHTIPNLFMLKHLGINNIYLESCPPNLVNPALIETLRQRLDLENYTTPEEDIAKILGKKE